MGDGAAEGYPREGVIYVASGESYLDLACRSAQSVREHNPGSQVDLFTDTVPVADTVEAAFDRVVRVPGMWPGAKIDCMLLSRFDRTLYLDCDTLVVSPMGDLFDLLERFELALAHDVRRRSALVQQGFAERTPYAFPQLNAGVVLYRRSAAMLAFLQEWARRFCSIGADRDQIALKDLLWRSELRFYVLPPEFNLRRVTVLDAWEPLDARPTIVHSHRLMDHMRRPGCERIMTLDRLREVEREALAWEWDEGRASSPTDARAPLPPMPSSAAPETVAPRRLQSTDTVHTRRESAAAG